MNDAVVTAGPVGDSSLRAAADTNGDGLLDESEAAAAQSMASSGNETAPNGSDPTITSVPGLGAGLTFLVLLGGVAFLARRLRA
ncbi:MAG: hypothetical protein HYT80_06580 [Euryarchaeota archaeon]|nr:hypothetical protein [Euryarchaeota archaeon]